MESNYRLVIYWARKIQNGRETGILEINDLFQEGIFGLGRAIDGFKRRKGYKFSTYASWCIRRAIQRAIDDSATAIRIPVHMRETLLQYEKVYGLLVQQLQREPADHELAQAMNISERKADELKRICTLNTTSIDEALADNRTSISAMNAIIDKAADTEMQAISGSVRDALEQALELLGDTPKAKREKEVLRLHFGLDGIQCTLDEIGERFNFTRERIRQIEAKALSKLRQPHILDLLDGCK